MPDKDFMPETDIAKNIQLDWRLAKSHSLGTLFNDFLLASPSQLFLYLGSISPDSDVSYPQILSILNIHTHL